MSRFVDRSGRASSSFGDTVESAVEVLETVVRGELGASVMSASVGATATAEMGGTTTLDLTPKLMDPSPAVATPGLLGRLMRNVQCIFPVPRPVMTTPFLTKPVMPTGKSSRGYGMITPKSLSLFYGPLAICFLINLK
jgi:hypothetical protein